MSLSTIVNHPYVDFWCFSHLLLVSCLWTYEQLASMVKTKATGVVHFYKFNPKCVSETLC